MYCLLPYILFYGYYIIYEIHSLKLDGWQVVTCKHYKYNISLSNIEGKN